MAPIAMEHGLLLAAFLFSLGLLGLLVRRNVLFVLMSLEIMLNAAALAFIAAGSRWAAPDGQIMFVLIVTLAASEAAVGLALVMSAAFYILTPRVWIGPALMAGILLVEVLALMYQGTLAGNGQLHGAGVEVTVKQVGIAMYGPYLLAVELASMLLLGALVAAYHLGRGE